MAETAKRDVLPDLLKALLILSVLLQHSATALKMGQHIGEGNWTNWLSASPFNMPLFMAICGYYFYYSAKRRTLGELLKSKLLMILVPCLAWTMLGKCTLCFLYGKHVDWAPWPWDLWFLWSAVICMLLGSICHYAFRRVEGWAMALLCGLLCLVPYDPYNVAYMFPFFTAGYMVSKHNLASKAKPWMGWVALAAYIGLHCFITRESSVWISHSFLLGERPVVVQLGLNAYRFLIGVFGSAAFAFIINRLYYASCVAAPPPPPNQSMATNQKIRDGAGAVLAGGVRLPGGVSGAVHRATHEIAGLARLVRSANHPLPSVPMGVHPPHGVHYIPSLPGCLAAGADQPHHTIPVHRQSIVKP